MGPVAWTLYLLLLLLLCDLLQYLWHRFGVHTDLLGFSPLHRLHHRYARALATEEFLWVFLAFPFLAAGLVVLASLALVSPSLVVVTLGLALGFFVLSWYLHQAFHAPSHWLNGQEWFDRMRKRHYVHHRDDSKNYSLVTFLMDQIFGTFQEGEGDGLSPSALPLGER